MDEVSSELYEEFDYGSASKPMVNKANCVSKFTFHTPPPRSEEDADGDLVVERRAPDKNLVIIEIEHRKSTSLGLVGLQIWRGALLLADWILYNSGSFNPEHFILELGSGVGLTSIIAGLYTKVFCTDINTGGLLKLIKGNIMRNKHLGKNDIKVLELDFTSQVLPREIVDNIEKIPIVVAADVVYDDVITDAFIRTVKHILSKPPERSVYIALEKRYVFTIADCDSVAPCYEFFLERLHRLDNVHMETVPLTFPQYFHYDRVKELVLWKITSKTQDFTTPGTEIRV